MRLLGKMPLPMMFGLAALLVPGVLAAQTQTSESAAQLGANFTGTGLPGLTPAGARGGGYPLLFSAPLYIALQPPVLWTPTVAPARLTVAPPDVEATHPVPLTDSDSSFGWRATKPLAASDEEGTGTSYTPAYTAMPGAHLSLRSGTASDVGSAEPSNPGLPAVGTVLDDAAAGMPAASMSAAQSMFPTSCLDSPSGCSLVAVPAFQVFTPAIVQSKASPASAVSALPMRRGHAKGRNKRGAKSSSSRHAPVAPKSSQNKPAVRAR